jgi:NADH:ubiquinone oxidoreductase subunit K
MVNLNSFLVLSAVMFAIGLFGALSKRNAVAILMSIEIMLNAVNITMVAFASAFIGKSDAAGVAVGSRLTGQIFAIFIITVAAAEAAVALAIIIGIYRRISTVDVGHINLMKW